VFYLSKTLRAAVPCLRDGLTLTATDKINYGQLSRSTIAESDQQFLSYRQFYYLKKRI